MSDELKLLVEWSSPWDEFRTALGPALGRSPRKLAGEAHTGLFPYRGMLICWLLEMVVLAGIVIIPAKIASLTPYQPPAPQKYDVIYYSGDELPRTEDAGGAQTGHSGRTGGKEAFHRTQTIRVSRGNSVREKVVDAPNLKLPVSNSAVANLLAFKPVPGPPPAEGLKPSLRTLNVPQAQVVAPSPSVQRQTMLASPMLNATVVAPSPRLQKQTMLPAPMLDTTVVAPSPSAPQRDLPALQIPGSRIAQVVPPPVSAPERAMANLNPKLTLPAPTVVAPAPAQLTRDLSQRGPGLGAGELQKQVVPPAVQMANGAMQRQAPSAFNGTAAVVPPPVQMATSSPQQRSVGGLGGSAAVVAPTVQVNGGALQRQVGGGLSGNVAVVAPAPSISGGSFGGHGQGTRGGGLGGAFDSGDVAAPPKGGGSGNGSGVVVSSKPGSQVGLPGGGGAGSLAMSPNGGKDAGLGGSGGGSSIGRGDGSGSGFSGEGPGAGKEGAGRGSDPNARAGLSPYPGPGGAGTGVNGSPAMPGVSVQGGSNNVVNLPSFGTNGDQPTDLSRSTVGKDHRGVGITVVATSRSGGAFNRYGYLKGDKVYTIYIDTSIGPAVMQMADPLSASRPSSEDLNAPEPIRTDLPAGISRSRLVVACVLNHSGILTNFQVLEPGSALMTSKVLAALPRWKFRPAMRGNQTVEVTAILGFNIDTSDHY
jgi:hypothetical protein